MKFTKEFTGFDVSALFAGIPVEVHGFDEKGDEISGCFLIKNVTRGELVLLDHRKQELIIDVDWYTCDESKINISILRPAKEG